MEPRTRRRVSDEVVDLEDLSDEELDVQRAKVRHQAMETTRSFANKWATFAPHPMFSKPAAKAPAPTVIGDSPIKPVAGGFADPRALAAAAQPPARQSAAGELALPWSYHVLQYADLTPVLEQPSQRSEALVLARAAPTARGLTRSVSELAAAGTGSLVDLSARADSNGATETRLVEAMAAYHLMRSAGLPSACPSGRGQASTPSQPPPPGARGGVAPASGGATDAGGYEQKEPQSAAGTGSCPSERRAAPTAGAEAPVDADRSHETQGPCRLRGADCGMPGQRALVSMLPEQGVDDLTPAATRHTRPSSDLVQLAACLALTADGGSGDAPAGTSSSRQAGLLEERVAALLAERGALGARAGSPHNGRGGAYSQWSQKYAPSCARQVCGAGNASAAAEITRWLESFGKKEPAEDARQGGELGQSFCTSSMSLQSMDSMDSEYEQGQPSKRAINPGMLVTGPTGCGKTAAIYASAEEVGVTVIEINPGVQRSGAHIMKMIGEATQSRRVDWSTHAAKTEPAVSRPTVIDVCSPYRPNDRATPAAQATAATAPGRRRHGADALAPVAEEPDGVLADISGCGQVFGNVPRKLRSPLQRKRSSAWRLDADDDDDLEVRAGAANHTGHLGPHASAAEVVDDEEPSTRVAPSAGAPASAAAKPAAGISAFFRPVRPAANAAPDRGKAVASAPEAAVKSAGAGKARAGAKRQAPAGVAKRGRPPKKLASATDSLQRPSELLGSGLQVDAGHKTLILFDEFDQLLEEDAGFVNTVIAMLQTSKTAIALTAEQPGVLDAFAPGLSLVRPVMLQRLEPVDAFCYLALVCSLELPRVPLPAVRALVLACGCDLRRSLLAAQVWLPPAAAAAPPSSCTLLEPDALGSRRPDELPPAASRDQGEAAFARPCSLAVQLSHSELPADWLASLRAFVMQPALELAPHQGLAADSAPPPECDLAATGAHLAAPGPTRDNAFGDASPGDHPVAVSGAEQLADGADRLGRAALAAAERRAKLSANAAARDSAAAAELLTAWGHRAVARASRKSRGWTGPTAAAEEGRAHVSAPPHTRTDDDVNVASSAPEVAAARAVSELDMAASAAAGDDPAVNIRLERQAQLHVAASNDACALEDDDDELADARRAGAGAASLPLSSRRGRALLSDDEDEDERAGADASTSAAAESAGAPASDGEHHAVSPSAAKTDAPGGSPASSSRDAPLVECSCMPAACLQQRSASTQQPHAADAATAGAPLEDGGRVEAAATPQGVPAEAADPVPAAHQRSPFPQTSGRPAPELSVAQLASLAGRAACAEDEDTVSAALGAQPPAALSARASTPADQLPAAEAAARQCGGTGSARSDADGTCAVVGAAARPEPSSSAQAHAELCSGAELPDGGAATAKDDGAGTEAAPVRRKRGRPPKPKPATASEAVPSKELFPRLKAAKIAAAKLLRDEALAAAAAVRTALPPQCVLGAVRAVPAAAPGSVAWGAAWLRGPPTRPAVEALHGEAGAVSHAVRGPPRHQQGSDLRAADGAEWTLAYAQDMTEALSRLDVAATRHCHHSTCADAPPTFWDWQMEGDKAPQAAPPPTAPPLPSDGPVVTLEAVLAQASALHESSARLYGRRDQCPTALAASAWDSGRQFGPLAGVDGVDEGRTAATDAVQTALVELSMQLASVERWELYEVLDVVSGMARRQVDSDGGQPVGSGRQLRSSSRVESHVHTILPHDLRLFAAAALCTMGRRLRAAPVTVGTA